MPIIKHWLMPLVVGLLLISGAAALFSQGPVWTQALAESEEATRSNPFTGDEAAIEEGQQLYLRYNCHGCHGREGGGGMGPNLTDAQWIFGGDDATVFEVIDEGRGGMPSFGQHLEEEEIWKIIAFIRSLYRGPPEAIVW